jgi:hypothetical protein
MGIRQAGPYEGVEQIAAEYAKDSQSAQKKTTGDWMTSVTGEQQYM